MFIRLRFIALRQFILRLSFLSIEFSALIISFIVSNALQPTSTETGVLSVKCECEQWDATQCSNSTYFTSFLSHPPMTHYSWLFCRLPFIAHFFDYSAIWNYHEVGIQSANRVTTKVIKVIVTEMARLLACERSQPLSKWCKIKGLRVKLLEWSGKVSMMNSVKLLVLNGNKMWV